MKSEPAARDREQLQIKSYEEMLGENELYQFMKKEEKKFEKRLRDIENLRKRRMGGEVLEKNQEEKIKREDEVVTEIHNVKATMEEIEEATNLEIARMLDPAGWEEEHRRKEEERNRINPDFQE